MFNPQFTFYACISVMVLLQVTYSPYYNINQPLSKNPGLEDRRQMAS